jgi:hypothetical protein
VSRDVLLVAEGPFSGFPSLRPGFDLKSGHEEFVVDKVALGQVSSEYFGFTCQFSFQRLLHTHELSSGAGTMGQLVADVPSVLSLTPLPRNKNKKKTTGCRRPQVAGQSKGKLNDVDYFLRWRL